MAAWWCQGGLMLTPAWWSPTSAPDLWMISVRAPRLRSQEAPLWSVSPTALWVSMHTKYAQRDLNVYGKEVAVEQCECGIKQSLNQRQLKERLFFNYSLCVYGLWTCSQIMFCTLYVCTAHPYIYPSGWPSVYSSACLPIHPSLHPSLCLACIFSSILLISSTCQSTMWPHNLARVC